MSSQNSNTITGSAPPELGRWYYCHSCNGTTRNVTQDYTCPSCNSGFIEDVSSARLDDNDDDDIGREFTVEPSMAQALQTFSHIMRRAQERRSGSSGERRDSAAAAAADNNRSSTTHGGTTGDEDDDDDSSTGDLPDPSAFIQEFITNFISGAAAGPSGSANVRLFTPSFLQMHGNPGDYAWGPGGLDAIVTQFLNRMDGTGPPPMKKEVLAKLKKLKVTQSIIDKDTQCSVCWEDYVMDEEVTQLDCEHVFHDKCIVPWLKLHGTCPICRKMFECDDESQAAEDDASAATSSAESEIQAPSTSATRSTDVHFGNAISQALGMIGIGSPNGGPVGSNQARESDRGEQGRSNQSSYTDFDVE